MCGAARSSVEGPGRRHIVGLKLTTPTVSRPGKTDNAFNQRWIK